MLFFYIDLYKEMKISNLQLVNAICLWTHGPGGGPLESVKIEKLVTISVEFWPHMTASVVRYHWKLE